MQDYDFGIRVDMGDEVGSGHFFRCLALARELRIRNKSVIFLLNEKNILSNHTDEPFHSLALRGHSETERIRECKELLKNIKVLIIDLPHHNGDYSKELGGDNNVVIIDDLGEIEIYSKFLINGSVVRKFHKYDIKNRSTRSFIGPGFMLIRKDFINFRDRVRITNNAVKNILMIFGGSDDENLTCKILPLLVKGRYEVTVVLGPTNSREEEVRRIAAGSSNVKIERRVEKIAELFAKQDLVISSSGVTTYELASLGIPTIMVPIVDAQNETAKAMEAEGFGINYGPWDGDLTRFEAVLKKMDDYELRKQMYEAGRKIVDGMAVSRISDILLTLV